jgi:hypothetical protein
MSVLPRPGDFDYHTAVGAFDARLEDLSPYDPVFGLNLQVQYLYGGLRAANGTMYVLERKFIGSMTSGLWFMSNKTGGHLSLQRQSLLTTRGEVKRTISDSTRHWSDAIMMKVPSELLLEGMQGLDITLTDRELSYAEGDLLSVSGTSAGAAPGFYVTTHDEPLYWVSMPFWVQGTVEGQPAEGGMFFDHGYWAHGREWKEYRVYQDTQVAWLAFINKFTDGSIEAGHLIKGTRGFNVAAVVEGAQPVVTSNQLDTTMSLDEKDFVTKGVFSSGSQDWEFVGDDDGRMLEFSNARKGFGYRAQSGLTRRRGDDRRLQNGWTWLECFADRIRSEHLVG